MDSGTNAVDRLEIARMNAALSSGGTSSDAIYSLVVRLLKDHRPSGKLLEYGAGTGSLIKSLITSGYSGRITGVDILARPAGLPTTVNWIQCDLNNSIPVESGSIDLVISTEVIEHLENPRAVFREWFRILRPIGKLIVTTPNQESIRSLFSLVGRGHFIAFLDSCYPAHITALLRVDLVRICAETGFAHPGFYFTDSGGIPKIPRILWQSISFGLLKGRLFSDNLALVTQKEHEAR
jgi:2-polyprenyl-3-methyl-5-hydroxy-6-metoxy-1,4-benzoquinol methylase